MTDVHTPLARPSESGAQVQSRLPCPVGIPAGHGYPLLTLSLLLWLLGERSGESAAQQ